MNSLQKVIEDICEKMFDNYYKDGNYIENVRQYKVNIKAINKGSS